MRFLLSSSPPYIRAMLRTRRSMVASGNAFTPTSAVRIAVYIAGWVTSDCSGLSGSRRSYRDGIGVVAGMHAHYAVKK